MKWNGFDVSANLSLLFAELPYAERFAAAAEAGFDRVETWWPFTVADPGRVELAEFLQLLRTAGLTLTGLNFFAGDMAGGERGIACRPERADELAANLRVVREVAQATGCRHFNLLHGQLDEAGDVAQQHRTALRSYAAAAAAVADLDGTVLVEPLGRGLNGSYPLTTHDEALSLVEEVGEPGLALLVDTFHLGMSEVDVPAAIRVSAGRIGHVQLADVPDRGEPGSGGLDWSAISGALQQADYAGVVAAEYRPRAGTRAGLGWLTEADRGAVA